MGAVTDYLYKRVMDINSNADVTIVGERGSGKSWASLKLAETLANRFNTPFGIDNIHFTAENFLSHVDRLTRGKQPDEVQPGNVLVLDEAGRGLNAQEWWENSIKALAGELETYRTYRMVTFLTTPRIGNITKRIREMTTCVLKPVNIMIINRKDLKRPATNIDFNSNVSRWKFYVLWTDPAPTRSSATSSLPMYRLRDGKGMLDSVLIKKPSRDLLKAYEVKKRAFLDGLRSDNLSSIRGEDKDKPKTDDLIENTVLEVIKRRDEFCRIVRDKWVVSYPLIQNAFGIKYSQAVLVRDKVRGRLNRHVGR